jgi:hypothetical protein
MPKAPPEQVDFTDFIQKNKEDFEEGFVWFLNTHILNGHIKLMGSAGKGWTIFSYFRARYTYERDWAKMPTWKEISNATGIIEKTVKKVSLKLEEMGFLRFDKAITPSGREKVINYQIIDNLFYQAQDGANRVEAVSQVFEPEQLATTLSGHKALKKTGDIGNIPKSFIDKNHPINIHITINNNIISQGDNSQSLVVQVGKENSPELEEFLQTKDIRDALGGYSLLEAIEQERRRKLTIPIDGGDT